jgi:perosamine synthetase
MIREKIGLIPRYNWDYGASDLAKAMRGIFAASSDASRVIETVFGEKPILTTSGRASLYVILKSLNLPEGSNVGVPLFCCPVVFDAIKQANLVPKFVDIELDDYSLSASDLEKKKNVLSAVIVVHMFGHPADMDSISEICKDIPVIEDCAQSLFSRYKGNYTGFQSIASFFSFRSGKYISAGEGSAIFCQDLSLREAIEKIVNETEEWNLSQEISHSLSTYMKSALYHKPWYGTLGYPIGRILDRRLNLTAKNGFRLRKISKGDMQILSDRIETFSSRVDQQRQNALYYLEKLRIKNVSLPFEREGRFSNYYQFAIRFEKKEQRDFVTEYLMKNGIDSGKYLDNIVDVTRGIYGYDGDCPNAELCSETVLVIPHYYTLSQRHLDRIVSTLNNAAKYLWGRM